MTVQGSCYTPDAEIFHALSVLESTYQIILYGRNPGTHGMLLVTFWNMWTLYLAQCDKHQIDPEGDWFWENVHLTR